MPERGDDLGLALDLVRRASNIALDHHGRAVSSELKTDGSPVTELDLAIESMLIDTLTSVRPDDAILSEERGEIGSADRRWLLDPLDGTSLFLDGVDGWGSLITLQERAESVVAVISRPLEDMVWWAVRDAGTFCGHLSGGSDRRCAVSMSDTLADARITAWHQGYSPEIEALSKLPGWRPPCADSVRLFLDGELDAIVSVGGLVWDHAPLVLLTEEAGGVFRDREGGGRLDLLGGVYANPRIVGDVGQLVGWF